MAKQKPLQHLNKKGAALREYPAHQFEAPGWDFVNSNGPCFLKSSTSQKEKADEAQAVPKRTAERNHEALRANQSVCGLLLGSRQVGERGKALGCFCFVAEASPESHQECQADIWTVGISSFQTVPVKATDALAGRAQAPVECCSLGPVVRGQKPQLVPSSRCSRTTPCHQHLLQHDTLAPAEHWKRPTYKAPSIYLSSPRLACHLPPLAF